MNGQDCQIGVFVVDLIFFVLGGLAILGQIYRIGFGLFVRKSRFPFFFSVPLTAVAAYALIARFFVTYHRRMEQLCGKDWSVLISLPMILFSIGSFVIVLYYHVKVYQPLINDWENREEQS